MTQNMLLGIWIVWVVVLLILYHKIFTVYYFNLGNGLVRELVVSVILGSIMTLVTLRFWYVAAIIIMLVGLSMKSKSGSMTPLILAVVLAIAVGVVGVQVGDSSVSEGNQSESNASFLDKMTGILNSSKDDSKEENTVGQLAESSQNDTEEETTEDNTTEDNTTAYDTTKDNIGEDETTDYDLTEDESAEDNSAEDDTVESQDDAGISTAESEYIFPDSDTEYLFEEDCDGLTAEQCKIARNEIYARHGRLFSDENLQAYFDGCSWYCGSIAPEDFSYDLLSEVEKDNLETIAAYESYMGYR